MIFDSKKSIFRPCLDPAGFKQRMLCHSKAFLLHLEVLQVNTQSDPPVPTLLRFYICRHEQMSEYQACRFILPIFLQVVYTVLKDTCNSMANSISLHKKRPLIIKCNTRFSLMVFGLVQNNAKILKNLTSYLILFKRDCIGLTKLFEQILAKFATH